jgi:hypothetical protein
MIRLRYRCEGTFCRAVSDTSSHGGEARGDGRQSSSSIRSLYMQKVTLFTLAFLFSLTTIVLAKPNVRTMTGNEYGGKTDFITYSADDREYKDGINEKITSYDRKGNVVRIEVHTTKNMAEREGWDTSITYYWGKTKIGERYSTDSDSASSGFYQTVDYLDPAGKLSRREFYVRPDSIIGTLGVYKRVVHYDQNGKQTKYEDLDRIGNPVTISLEDYRKAQKKVQGSIPGQ